MAREKEIFRDCYNMLTDNVETPNWPNISMTAQELINGKYAGDALDQFLCSELVGVIVNHLGRKG